MTSHMTPKTPETNGGKKIMKKDKKLGWVAAAVLISLLGGTAVLTQGNNSNPSENKPKTSATLTHKTEDEASQSSTTTSTVTDKQENKTEKTEKQVTENSKPTNNSSLPQNNKTKEKNNQTTTPCPFSSGQVSSKQNFTNFEKTNQTIVGNTNFQQNSSANSDNATKKLIQNKNEKCSIGIGELFLDKPNKTLEDNVENQTQDRRENYKTWEYKPEASSKKNEKKPVFPETTNNDELETTVRPVAPKDGKVENPVKQGSEAQTEPNKGDVTTPEEGKDQPTTPEKPKGDDGKGEETVKPGTGDQTEPNKGDVTTPEEGQTEPATPEKPKGDDGKVEDTVKPGAGDQTEPKKGDVTKPEEGTDQPTTPEKPKGDDGKGEETVKPGTDDQTEPEKGDVTKPEEGKTDPATPEKPKGDDGKGEDAVKPGGEDQTNPNKGDVTKPETGTTQPTTPEKPKGDDGKGEDTVKPGSEGQTDPDKGDVTKPEAGTTQPTTPSTPTNPETQPTTPPVVIPEDKPSHDVPTNPGEVETPTPGTETGNTNVTETVTPGGENPGTATEEVVGSTTEDVFDPAPRKIPVEELGSNYGSQPVDQPGTGETPAVPETEVETPVVKKVVTTQTVVVKTVIEHDTIERKGDQYVPVVVQEGADGEMTRTYTVTLEDGVEVSRVLVSEVVTKEPQTRIVETALSPFDEKENRIQMTIRHGVRYVEDENLPEGERVVDVEGRDGSYTLVQMVDGFGNVGATRRENEVPAVDQVIRIGTKKAVVENTTRTSEEREVLNFETVTRQDQNLPEGQEVTETEGRDGYVVYTITETVAPDGRVVSSDRQVKERVEAVNKVVKVGTKKPNTVRTREEREVLNFETVKRQDSNLPEGQEVTETEGRNGYVVYTVTETVTPDGTVVSSDRQIKERVEAVNKVVKVGTKKPNTVRTREEREVLNFETVTRHDQNLPEGQEVTETEGRDGYVVYTVTETVTPDGKVVSSDRQVKERVEAVNKVVKVGTKKPNTVRTREEREVLNFETVTRQDQNLPEGQEVTEMEGRNGYVVYTVTETVTQDGRVVSSDRQVKERVEAVNKVVKVGTKKATPSTEQGDYDLWFRDDVSEESRQYYGLKQSLKAWKEELGDERFAEEVAKNEDFAIFTSIDELDQPELDKISRLLDVDKFNYYFGLKLNELRRENGLEEAVFAGKDSRYYEAVEERAREMVYHGSLRYQGEKSGKHKRPDGSKWYTIYSEEERNQFTGVNENAAERLSDAYGVTQALSEKWLADLYFDMWLNSPGHKRTMLEDFKEPKFAIATWLGPESISAIARGKHLQFSVGIFHIFSTTP